MKFLPTPKIEGYEHPDLVDAIFRKTVAFQPSGDWPEIEGARTVLDFGGGCGLHYRQANSPTARWAVVETAAMVGRARELETANLRFFTEIEPAAEWLRGVDVMHSNGALQYAADPQATLAQLCSLNTARILWYRTFLSRGAHAVREAQTSRLRDNGPQTARVKRASVSVERTSIPEADFLRCHRDYELKSHGADWFVFVKKPV